MSLGQRGGHKEKCVCVGGGGLIKENEFKEDIQEHNHNKSG